VQTRIIGIAGLGIMGGSIARNLVKAGFGVIGYDPDAARSDVARGNGVETVDSPEAVAAGADVMLTSLPKPAALDEVARSLAGLAEAKRQGLIIAELSTLPLTCKLENRDRLSALGVTLLDCPLSGTGAQAVTGDVVVYASGDENAYQCCEEVFSGFARATRYLGEFGNGTKMKLIANLLVAIHNVASAEAILLGVRGGLDPSTLCEVLGSGAGGSRVFELRAPLMVAEEYEPATMKLDVWKKDMNLINDFAESCGVATPLFSATAPLYDAAIAAGRGHEDTAAVYEVLKELGRDGGG
jgi:3-hydroxyisobutyrate dehydrogenase-like beta-hydroxyacid dehydrogenase